MHRLIYYFIQLIIRLHNKFLSINDNHQLDLTDKQLHFLVVGIFGVPGTIVLIVLSLLGAL